MNGDYSKTVKLLNVLQLAGWLVMIAGIIGGFVVYDSAGFISAVIAGGPVFVFGLFLMATAQVAGVLIDIARSNQSILEAMLAKQAGGKSV